MDVSKDVEELGEEDEMGEVEETEMELPVAVAEAIRTNCPDKEIDKLKSQKKEASLFMTSNSREIRERSKLHRMG